MTTNPSFDIPQFTMADRLRKAREHAGVDQRQFADELGIARATVSNYERGAVQPRKIVLKAWALRTGVPLEWLETGEVPSGNNGGGGESMVNIYYLPTPSLELVA